MRDSSIINYGKGQHQNMDHMHWLQMNHKKQVKIMIQNFVGTAGGVSCRCYLKILLSNKYM